MNVVILIFYATKRLSVGVLRDNDINVYTATINTAINSIANK